MADQALLPEGQEFFKLNEVCKLANVQPYMLRFWGTEFQRLEASRSGTGQRLYNRDQVILILEIRRLLFDDGMTIAGARKRVLALQEEGALPEPGPPVAPKTRKRAGKTKPARKKAAPPAKKRVDKPGPDRVKPLVTALRQVREEISQIMAEAKD